MRNDCSQRQKGEIGKHIVLTCPCNENPCGPFFYIHVRAVKLGSTGVDIIFFLFALNIDHGNKFRTALSRRGGSNVVVFFFSKIHVLSKNEKNITILLSENFHFYSRILHRRVCIIHRRFLLKCVTLTAGKTAVYCITLSA